MLGIMPRGAGIDWDKVIFKGLTLQGIYGRRMYETWYKMTQMVLTGFPLQKVLTHQIAGRLLLASTISRRAST
jgi:threonine 3-dehydrogenase